MPVFKVQKSSYKKPLNQLMVAADVGGAIKGEIRADFSGDLMMMLFIMRNERKREKCTFLNQNTKI